jgi:hypothetical protein
MTNRVGGNFTNIEDALNYLHGVEDGAIDIGEYDIIKIDFINQGEKTE